MNRNPLEFAWKKSIAVPRIIFELAIIVGVFHETGIFTALAIFLVSLLIECQSYLRYREYLRSQIESITIDGEDIGYTVNFFSSEWKIFPRR